MGERRPELAAEGPFPLGAGQHSRRFVEGIPLVLSAPAPRDGRDLALLCLAGFAGVAGVLWLGGAGAAVLAGDGLPPGPSLAGLVALAHPSDPSLAWHRAVGPAPLYWTVVGLVLGLVATLATGLVRLARAEGASDERGGLATRAEVRRFAGERALLRRSDTLRPSVARPRPEDLGYRLGTSRGLACYASVEDSMVLLGPPRSGKGMNLVVPMLLDAPGAVVTTSTRPDNLSLTLDARAGRGPVALFDPEGLAAGPALPRLRWSPLRGCEVPQVAMSRAAALVVDRASAGVENGAFWREQTVAAVRCLLHAAALDGRPPAALYTWSHAAARAREAVAILAGTPGAAPGWDAALDAIVSADPRTRDAIWAMVANTFAPLADPDVLDAVSPEAAASFDPVSFLASSGTLYLLGTASGASATARLVAALVEDVVHAARRLAARSVGVRLDPPLALLLDEAANYPIGSLPALMAEGGGSGITTVAVFQSLAQARERFGRDGTQAIWDAAIVKVILGGSASAADLADLSQLLGERDVLEHQQSRGVAAHSRTVSTSVRRRAILDPAAIRRLGVGEALLVLRAAPPMVLRLRPWTQRGDAGELRAARARFERDVAAVSDG